MEGLWLPSCWPSLALSPAFRVCELPYGKALWQGTEGTWEEMGPANSR